MLYLRGKKGIGDRILDIFEDVDLRIEERKPLFEQLDEGTFTKGVTRETEKRAFQILFLSNLDKTSQQIHELYKTRDLVEKHFDTLKNEIRAEVLCLSYRSAIGGYLFIGFLCLYIYCRLMARIKKADLTVEYSPKDVLLIFSKLMKISYDRFDQIAEVPKKVRDFEKKLGVE